MHLSMLRWAVVFVAMAFASCARPLPKYEKPMARTTIQHVRTTAYTHTESDHREHGCQTCLGTTLRYGAVHSAAADWSRWPAGTLFRILDTGEICEVDDIGWALSGRNTIDLYKPSNSSMNAWGTRMVDIEILRWGDDGASLEQLNKRRKYRHVQRMVADLEGRIRRGETNPEPMLAAAPTTAVAAAPVVPVVAGGPAPVSQPMAAPQGVVLRKFRPGVQ
jgi:3D (Asp-Asp-Asp) domain-containing protein